MDGEINFQGMKYCKNHPELRSHGNELCINCWSQYQRDNNTSYAQHQRQLTRDWQKKNSANYQRKTYANNPNKFRSRAKERWANLPLEKRWEINLKCTYGIDANRYYQILREQNDVCAICHKPPLENQKLVVDHRHTTPTIEIRGLLCSRCNTLVGYIDKTESNILERAIQYASSEPVAKTSIRNRRARSTKIAQRK